MSASLLTQSVLRAFVAMTLKYGSPIQNLQGPVDFRIQNNGLGFRKIIWLVAWVSGNTPQGLQWGPQAQWEKDAKPRHRSHQLRASLSLNTCTIPGEEPAFLPAFPTER